MFTRMKRIVLIAVALTALAAASYFLGRDYFLKKIISKAERKLALRGIRLATDKASFTGLNTIHISGVSLIPETGDTIMQCSSIRMDLVPWRWVTTGLPVNHLKIDTGYLQLIQYSDSTSNFANLFSSRTKTPETTETESGAYNFLHLFETLRKQLTILTSFNIEIVDFNLRFNSPRYSESLFLHEFNLFQNHYELRASEHLNSHVTTFRLNGDADPAGGKISFWSHKDSPGYIYFPFAKKFDELKVFTEAVGGEITIHGDRDEKIYINIQAATIHPGINHWRIGPDDVTLDSLSVHIATEITRDAIRTTDTCFIKLNQIPVWFTTELEKSANSRFRLTARINQMDARAFFNSLPDGLFNSLTGLESSGKLSYHLNFEVDMNEPDSLIFESELKGQDFKIEKFGKENLTMINGEFIHDALDGDKVVRSIAVGPSNPYFCRLENISPLLVNSVLIAEDGSFYSHRGFSLNAFRKSMATNIKERRFARGGSTISMQLVKNVFLNRGKNISRKIEEALIVWLIENERLVSKQRMLEVYLNIIEWGPGIYGIGEASEYYFSKHPSQLNMDESIFLSAIIPRPKYFRYHFDKEGKLKPYLENYFRLVSGRLVSKSVIDESQLHELKFEVSLSGRARELVVPSDTLLPDSLPVEEPLLFFE